MIFDSFASQSTGTRSAEANHIALLHIERAFNPDHSLIGYRITVGESVALVWLNQERMPGIRSGNYFVGRGVYYEDIALDADAQYASRYRWLRDNCVTVGVQTDGKFGLPDLASVSFVWRRREWADGHPIVVLDTLDAAIDAERPQRSGTLSAEFGTR